MVVEKKDIPGSDFKMPSLTECRGKDIYGVEEEREGKKEVYRLE